MTALGYLTKKAEDTYQGALQLLNFKGPITPRPLGEQARVSAKDPDTQIIANQAVIGRARNGVNKVSDDYVASAITHPQPRTGSTPIFANLGAANDQDDPDVLAIIAS